MVSPEIKPDELLTYNYPLGYFEAQTIFAQRLSTVADIPLPEAINRYTALCRRLTGQKKGQDDPAWINLLGQVSQSPDQASDIFWEHYLKNPRSLYEYTPPPNDGHHFGGYIYKDAIDKSTGLQKIELHFEDGPRNGGPSLFSASQLSNRIADMSRLVSALNHRMSSDPSFRPQTVTLGSWMCAFPTVKESLPPAFVASGVILRPPQLSFGGDSLWGQFLTKLGTLNLDRANSFLGAISHACSLDQLVDAFPMPVIFYQASIRDFIEHYRQI